MRHLSHSNLADDVDHQCTLAANPRDRTQFRERGEKSDVRPGPLISVIIPTFNRESRIGRAVFSALDQTYPNIEILVCDDGSADSTLYVLERISRKDDRLKIFRNDTNRGVSYTRNKLLAESRGDYIVFLDSDDELYDANVLKQISNIVSEEHCDMLLTDYISATDLGVGHFAETVPNRSINVRSMPGAVVNVHSLPTLIYEAAFWAFVYNKHFLVERRIEFQENLLRWEDRPFMFSALANADQIVITHLISRTRYRNNSSIMANMHGDENYRRRGPEDLQMVLAHLKTTRAAFGDLQEKETALEVQKRVQLLNFNLFVERGLIDVVYLERMGFNVETLRRQFRAFFEPVTLRRHDFARLSGFAPIPLDRASRLHKIYLAVQSGKYEEALQRANAAIWKDLVGSSSEEKRSSFVVGGKRKANQTGLKEALTRNDIERVTFHIGFHKTGSTFIQTRLMERREELRNEGVLFPISLFQEKAAMGLSRGRRCVGHEGFIEYANRHEGFIEYANRCFGEASSKCEAFIEEIDLSNCKHILLSAENLCLGLGQAQMMRLREELSSVKVKVVCLIRNPADWLESYYTEMVTGGWFREARRLSELLVPEGQRLVDYYTRLHPWREGFGNENVSAKSYEYGVASGLSLDEYFLQDIGIHLEPSKSSSASKRENVSFNRLETEAVRIFNSCCSALCSSREEYRQGLHKLLNALTKLRSNEDSCSILSPQSKEHICTRWSEVGRNLVKAGVLPEHHLDYILCKKADSDEWAPLEAMPLEYLDQVFRYVPNKVGHNLMRRSGLRRRWKAVSGGLFRMLTWRE